MKTIKILSTILLSVSLCACSLLPTNKPSEKENVEESESSELKTILTEHLWINDANDLTFYEFDTKGNILSYKWNGTGTNPAYNANNHVISSVALLESQYDEKKNVGTYSVHSDYITLNINGEDSVDVAFETNTYTTRYLERYEGEYFLFEKDYKPKGEINESPMYLYGVSQKDIQDIPYASYYGYYEMHDNLIKEIIRVDVIAETTISGKYVYAINNGNDYAITDFEWDITEKDPLTGTENNVETYSFKNNNIFVNYANGSSPRTFIYIGGEENLVHPRVDLFGDLTPPAFYGIWTGKTTSLEAAQNETNALRAFGYDAKIYLTTEWTNLDPIPAYMISTGEYGSEEEAQASLESVKATGRNEAYIQYTGTHY